MIQLNILPDVKLEYLKAQRTRRLVFTVCFLVTIVSIALLVLLSSVWLLEKKHISDLTTSIADDNRTLQNQPNIIKVMTVQNQLNNLSRLHSSKPAAPRLFDYFNQVTPTSVGITSVMIDFNLQQITINGTTDSLSSVNKYVDTLKFTKYSTDGKSTSDTKAFKNVVMSSFGVSSTSTQPGKGATYSLTLKYDQPIFDITKKVTLIVPSQTTTRSVIDAPALFQNNPTNNKVN